MSTIPRSADEYRHFWKETYPNTPFGTCVCGCGQETAIAQSTNVKLIRFKGEPNRYVQGHSRRKYAPSFHGVNQNGGLCECGCKQAAPIAPSSNHEWGTVKGLPQRYIHGHNACRTPYSKVEYLEEDRGFSTRCWVWKRMKHDNGYGLLRANGALEYAHRYYYMKYVGPIPAGKELDHLCRQRDCCRPSHLEPVTRHENIMRGAIAKLTDEDVRDIRHLHSEGMSGAEIARRYNIDPSYSYKICNGKCR